MDLVPGVDNVPPVTSLLEVGVNDIISIPGTDLQQMN